VNESDEARFATDLYQGTAEYYDRYRLPYRRAMLEDLATRARVSEHGRLLDLACGTGQLAFALRRRFAEVWAVDQEPDMVDLVRTKAAAMSAGHIRPVASSAESLEAEPGYFELAVIGNAFHRLDRDSVARRILGWLQPGGHLALCWASTPWAPANTDWQRALADVLGAWQARLGAEDRVPEGWDTARRERPDVRVLADAGFEVVGRQEFSREHRWSLLELAGLIRSTSFLPASVLGEQSAAFDADLADALRPYAEGGVYAETVSFAYELARRPPGPVVDERADWA
jgi:ubiquinone/menaquinone biosynthesis C-methylase UbiE